MYISSYLQSFLCIVLLAAVSARTNDDEGSVNDLNKQVGTLQEKERYPLPPRVIPLEELESNISQKFGGLLTTALNDERPNALYSSNYDLPINDQGMLDLELVVFSEDLIDTVVSKATLLGFEVTAVNFLTINGRVPSDAVSELASIEEIKFGGPALVATGKGSVQNQAVTEMKVKFAQDLYPDLDGTGLTIGILSDSFNCLDGYKNAIASGDLPDDVVVLKELTDCPAKASDEGRGMAELVHDIVPKAKIMFHSAFEGMAAMANGIQALADAGCDVIVDDVTYLQAAAHQDDIISQTVDSVVSNGVPYFSSAGNFGSDGYNMPFSPSGTNNQQGEMIHNWASLDKPPMLRYRYTFTKNTYVLLHWDQPSFSITGSIGSNCDVNIYLYDSNNSLVSYHTYNNIGRNPFAYVRAPSTGTFEVEITLVSGPAPLLTLINIGNPYDGVYNDLGPGRRATSFGHANSALAAGVGMQSWFANEVTLSSSRAGVPILFDKSGNRLSVPEFREQPLVVGTDGSFNTFFGHLHNGNYYFFGTSAAAPNAAAVAVLMLQADQKFNQGKRTLSPVELYTIMAATATDMDNPDTPGFDEGYDVATGYGLVNANAAVEAIRQLSESSNTAAPTTAAPTTASPTTAAPTTTSPTTAMPTTASPTTAMPVTAMPTTVTPTTATPTTASPTTAMPTTATPTTATPTTASPTPAVPTTAMPTTATPTTTTPTTATPTTATPTTAVPVTTAPTAVMLTTSTPTTATPTTATPTTDMPTTATPTMATPTTATPTTATPTTAAPTTATPTTAAPTTAVPATVTATATPTTTTPATPTTATPTTVTPTTAMPTTATPTTATPTTAVPVTAAPTTAMPTTAPPSGSEAMTTAPTTNTPTTTAPTTAEPTTAFPTTSLPTTAAPVTLAPTIALPTTAVPTTTTPTTAVPTTLAPTTSTPTTATPTPGDNDDNSGGGGGGDGDSDGGGNGTHLPLLPSPPSDPTSPALPTDASLPGIASLPSDPTNASLPADASLPGIASLPSDPTSPALPTDASSPGIASLPSDPTSPALPTDASLPGIASLPSAPTNSSLPADASLPGIASHPTVPGMLPVVTLNFLL